MPRREVLARALGLAALLTFLLAPFVGGEPGHDLLAYHALRGASGALVEGALARWSAVAVALIPISALDLLILPRRAGLALLATLPGLAGAACVPLYFGLTLRAHHRSPALSPGIPESAVEWAAWSPEALLWTVAAVAVIGLGLRWRRARGVVRLLACLAVAAAFVPDRPERFLDLLVHAGWGARAVAVMLGLAAWLEAARPETLSSGQPE